MFEDYIVCLDELWCGEIQLLYDLIWDVVLGLVVEVLECMIGYGLYYYCYLFGCEGDSYVIGFVLNK